MRILTLAILATGTISLASPAQAQTYGPNAPVCLQVYGPINYFECRYDSIAQCNQTAAGRSAQCVVNPYLANASQGPATRRRGSY